MAGRRAHGGETTRLAERDGPFGKAPLAKLPTDPDRLLRALNAAYGDGSYAAPRGVEAAAEARREHAPRRDDDRTTWLMVESNATPALRAAGFGVLERLGGAKDLGTVRDAEGRAGRGLEVAWGGSLPRASATPPPCG